MRDWSPILSLGAQQRLAFAPVTINRPRFIFLDEATSAVDGETERHLYELLQSTGATLISVGHRSAILRYHGAVLTLLAEGEWQFDSREE